jgi:predicted glycosyltransferase
MRARLPDSEGFVERDGVKVSYELFGHDDPTIVLMPPWSIVHSRTWKMQVPFPSRHYRVITLDPRGNGRYITGFDPSDLADRAALRSELGYAAQDKVCIVTVGGSSTGLQLLRRIIDSFPAALRAVPGLRMIIVAGPRIDPRLLSARDGVELHAYVHDLYRHLAACDLAVVQGGLTTTMELVANNRPFLYFPLGRHFEQTFHVPHRLARYHAGQRMDYATATPEIISSAIAAEIGKHVIYRPIDPEAVSRVACQIAEIM